MTQLEQILIGAIGFGIVAIAGFAARIMWVVLPRQLANNERQTRAVEQMSQTVAWLPYVLSSNEARFEAALSRGLSQLQAAGSAESEKLRVLFEAMFDRMQEAIERRLSGQEQALHENQVEMARTTGTMKAVSASASGKLTAVTTATATQVFPAEPPDSARETIQAPAPTEAKPGRGSAGGRPAHPLASGH